jgi:hypothetical protein
MILKMIIDIYYFIDSVNYRFFLYHSKRFASVISRRMSTADDAITIRSSTNDVLSEGTDASSTTLGTCVCVAKSVYASYTMF